MKRWIARDKDRVFAKTPPCVCLFFGEKPQLVNGYFLQPNNRSGRNPISHSGIRLKPGELAEIKIVKVTPIAQ